MPALCDVFFFGGGGGGGCRGGGGGGVGFPQKCLAV